MGWCIGIDCCIGIGIDCCIVIWGCGKTDIPLFEAIFSAIIIWYAASFLTLFFGIFFIVVTCFGGGKEAREVTEAVAIFDFDLFDCFDREDCFERILDCFDRTLDCILDTDKDLFFCFFDFDFVREYDPTDLVETELDLFGFFDFDLDRDLRFRERTDDLERTDDFERTDDDELERTFFRFGLSDFDLDRERERDIERLLVVDAEL